MRAACGDEAFDTWPARRDLEEAAVVLEGAAAACRRALSRIGERGLTAARIEKDLGAELEAREKAAPADH